MRCPYCAEDVKDDAVVCKHCHRELFVIKSLVDKHNELQARLDSLDVSEPERAAAPERSRAAAGRPQGWGLSVLETFALGYICHVVAHFLINVQFDLNLLYYKLASIAVPALFGLLMRPFENKTLTVGLVIGFAIAITAIPSELAVIAAVDKTPFWPTGAQQWNEFALHSISVAFGLLTGVIIRQLLMAIYVPSARPNKAIEWIARFIVEQFGDGRQKFTLKAIRSMVSSILGFVSAVVSIFAGMWEYLLKPH